MTHLAAAQVATKASPLSLVAFLLLSSACGDDVSLLPFDVDVVHTSGESPLDLGLDIERVRVQVQQADGELYEDEGDADTFGLSLPLDSTETDARVRVQFIGREPLLGAPPPFSPAGSGGFLRILVGAPSTCGTLPVTPPRGTSFSRVGTFLMGLGGEDAAVDAFDLLRLAIAPLTSLETPGLTRSAPVGGTQLIIVGASESVLYDAAVDPSITSPMRTLALHDGAGPDSTLIALASGSALVAGPHDGLSIVATDARVIRGNLENPPAAFTSLVAAETTGSATAGAMLFGASDGELFAWAIDADRGEGNPLTIEGATALPAELLGAVPQSDGSVWLIVESGASFILSCTQNACEMAEGPTFPETLQRVSVERSALGVHAFAAGEMLYRLSTDGVQDADDPRALLAVAALEDSAPNVLAITHLDGGIALVLSATTSGSRRELQLCVPDSLEPLD